MLTFNRLLAIFVGFYFLHLIPFSKVLYSPLGVNTSVTNNWTFLSQFLGWLYFWPMPLVLLIIGCLCCVILFFKEKNLIAQILVLILWIMIYNFNNMANSPINPYIGWILLMLILAHWIKVDTLLTSTWIVFGVSYAFAALLKMQSYFWIEGSIATFLLRTNLLISPGLFTFIAEVTWLDAVLTYGVLIIQGLCVFTYTIPRLRTLGWWSITLLHLSILITLTLPSVAIGMLIVQLYLKQEILNAKYWRDLSQSDRFQVSWSRCLNAIRFVNRRGKI